MAAPSIGCILVSDLDDTLVATKPSSRHEPDEALFRLQDAWARAPSDAKLLVYCTGRSLVSYNKLRAEVAPVRWPDPQAALP
jgi:hydroxymethylpyrimidine pyrophosphatase-like HAD family hydrolase